MIYISKDRQIHVVWSIFRGTSDVHEDFSRALVKVFLIGNYEKYLLEAVAEGGNLVFDIPQGLPEGAYSLEAIWVKNYNNLLPCSDTLTPSVDSGCRNQPLRWPFKHPHDHRFNDRCIMRSRKDFVFALTEYDSESTFYKDSGEAEIKIRSAVATYGYDGLSAYEIAVLRGDFNGTEGEYLDSLKFKLEVAQEYKLGGITAVTKTDDETEEVKVDPETGRLYVKPGGGSLSVATETKLGGIKAANKTSSETVEVKIDPSTGKLYVPAGGGSGGITSIPQANETELGGVKASNRTSKETLEAKIDQSSGKLFVEDKGLTIDEQDKFDSIEEGANKTTVEQTLTDSTTNPPSSKIVKDNFNTIQSQVSALSGIDNPFVGFFANSGSLPSQSSPSWALVGELSAAKPYAYYVAGSVPSGYSEGWNDLSGALGTYDFTKSSVWGYIVPYDGTLEGRLTLAQAIEKVPQALRQPGLRVLFVDKDGIFQEYIALYGVSTTPTPPEEESWEQGAVTVEGLEDGNSKRIRSAENNLEAGSYTVSVNSSYNVVVWDVTSGFEMLTNYGTSVSFIIDSTKSVRFVIKRVDEGDITPSDVSSTGFELGKGTVPPEEELPEFSWEQGAVSVVGLTNDTNRIRSLAVSLGAGDYTVEVNSGYNVVAWDVTSGFTMLTNYGTRVSFTLDTTKKVRFVIKKMDDAGITPSEVSATGFDFSQSSFRKRSAFNTTSESQDNGWIPENFAKVRQEDWGTGTFYGISQDLFTKKTFIFNADYEAPLEAGNYYTLDQVIDIVPDVLIKPGLLLMFKVGSYQYKIYQFISTSVQDFRDSGVRNIVFRELTNSANEVNSITNVFALINSNNPNNLYSVRNVLEMAVNNASPGELLYPSQLQYGNLWNYRAAVIPVEGEKTYTLSGWHIPIGKSISLLDINKNVLDTRNMNSYYSGSNIVKMGEWDEPGDITITTPSKCCYVAINVANDTYKDYFKFANIIFVEDTTQEELPTLDWEQGAVTIIGLNNDANRIRSLAEELPSGNYTVSVNSSYNVVAWDVTNGFAMLTSYGTSVSFTISSPRSVRFVIKRVDEGNITPSEVSSTGFELEKGQGYTGGYAKGQKHLTGYVDFDDLMLNDLSWPSGFACRAQIRVLSDKTRTKFIPLFDVHSKIIKGNKTVYISPDGDHSGTGLLPSTAVKTIAEALALKPSTIVFLPGTYTVDKNYLDNQQITVPINLIGYGEVTIDNLEKSPIQIKNNAYIENIHFKGGINGALNPYLLNDDYYVACYKCKFTDAKTSASLGGFRAQGGNYYMVDCEASDNFYDGFNYHAIDGHIPHVLEIDCRGYMNGIGSDYYSQNCSTAHEGAKVIRVNCDYGYSQGGVVADANANTVSVNIGCVAHSSLWFGSDHQNYNVSFWTGSGAIMYLIGCRSYGSNYDLSVEGSSSIYSDELFERKYNDGSGTITNISYF